MSVPNLCCRLSLTAIGILLVPLIAHAQQPPPPPTPQGDNVQELTRGPIHEAFGEPIRFDPEPGPVVPKEPPAQVEEVPPDQKPEGENVAWIPGYWAWDDGAKDFIWVSGFWRNLPPGRNWVPGYWTKADDGYQYISGFWAPDTMREIEYLPEPPDSLENGPPTEPAEGKMWVPGCWVWHETRYAWRPGYWAAVNPDWVWVPDHYCWTPNGYVFIAGFWDYPALNRGLLFAPVMFARYRPGLVYTPSVVLDVRYLIDSLFVGPRHGHYYFGDYYDSHYVREGYYPWFAFHNSRYGYDPIYAHMRHTMARRDPRWEDHLRSEYYNRRDHEAARPPHRYRDYTEWARKSAGAGREVHPVARSLRDVPATRDFPTRLERVPEKQTQEIRNQIKQVQKFRDDRSKLEHDGAQALPHVGRTDGKEPTRKLEPKDTIRPKEPTRKFEPKERKGDTTPPIRKGESGKPPTRKGDVREPERPNRREFTPRHEPGRVKLPEAPHLGPPAGTKSQHIQRLPEQQRAPEINPKITPPKTRGTTERRLPTPEDIIRNHGPKHEPMPKERPMPKGKGNPPSKKDRGKDGGKDGQ